MNIFIHHKGKVTTPSPAGEGWGWGLLLFFVLLCSCGPGSDEFRIRGEIEGMEQSDLLIYSTESPEPRIDTIHVREGRFAYAGHTRQATPYIIVFPNAFEQVIYATGGASIEYEAKASDLRNYKVKGTKENELLNSFRHDTRKSNPIETRDRAETFIRKHKDSPVVLYLFEKYFVQDLAADTAKVAELRTLLEAEHPNSRLLLMLGRDLQLQGRTSVGKTVEVPDSIILADHTLLYFWASWQAMAWSNMGNVRKAVKPYTRRQLNTVTVTVDVTDEQWRSYTNENDSSTIRHLFDGLAWDTPLARQFNIHQVPTYVILDRKKTIVSRFSNGERLEEELRKAIR